MDLDSRLRALKEDRRAGSAVLGRRALDLLALAAAAPAAALALPGLVRRVSLARPVLAAPGVLARRWLAEVCRGLGRDPALARSGILAAEDPNRLAQAGEAARHLLLDELSRASRSRRAAAGALFAPGMTVLTVSRSSQVEELLLELPEGSRVLAAESRPGGEGALLAAALAGAGRAAAVVADSAVAAAAVAADLILLGCDAVLGAPTLRRCRPDGDPGGDWSGPAPDIWFVNKVGSHALLLAARAAGRPAVLVLGAEKCTADPARPFIRGGAWDRKAFEAMSLRAATLILGDEGEAGSSWLETRIGVDRLHWYLFMN